MTADPDDDYLVALAREAKADFLVSGDRHLREAGLPDVVVLSPAEFLRAPPRPGANAPDQRQFTHHIEEEPMSRPHS